jgi:hypothetical protein
MTKPRLFYFRLSVAAILAVAFFAVLAIYQ